MKYKNQRNLRGFCLALAGMVWLTTATVQPAQAAYHALIVGVNQYLPSYIHANQWLGGCVNDAIGLRGTLLTDTNRWKATRISTLLNSSATETAIRARLRSKASALDAGDVFVYYQSSHGGETSGRNCHLCCYSSSFTDVELGHALARFDSGVKIFVILDACHSAGMFKSKKTGEWNFVDNVLSAYKETRAKAGDKSKSMGWNIAFMTAADYYEVSWSTWSGPSDYTKYLLQTCNKPIEDKDPRDGYYSFWEVHSYAKRHLLLEHNPGGDIQYAQHRNYSQLRNSRMIQVKIKAPTPIGPTGSTIARPLFTWTQVDGAKYYRLQVFNNSGRLVRDYNRISTIAGRPASKLANGSYTWRVRGYTYANVKGAWSQKLSFVVNPSGAFIRRATLTWGATPRDLDSWLLTPTGVRVGYSSKGSQSSAPYAQLDVDDTTSYGPENVSIYHYTPSGGAVYKYYVHQYSSDGAIGGCGARVSVQSQTGILRTFVCPGGAGRYWHVFNMYANGNIVGVNRIQASPP